MMKPQPFIVAAAVFSAVAQAQVIYTGYSESSTSVSATAVGSYSGSVVPILAAGEAGFTTDDVFSFRIDRGASSASATQAHYFSLQTDNLPVRLDLLTGLFDGKLIYGGGGLATDYTVDLTGKVSIYEYDDANGNNKFDPIENAYLAVTTGAIPLASLAANGTSVYDTSGSGPQSYILGANTNYMLALETRWTVAGTAVATDPSVVITVEHVTPLFSGHTATFDYQTVPEPTTATLLAMAAVLLRRRRR